LSGILSSLLERVSISEFQTTDACSSFARVSDPKISEGYQEKRNDRYLGTPWSKVLENPTVATSQ
jgi:hypothetical protein